MSRYDRLSLQAKLALQVVLSTTVLFAILIPLVLYIQKQVLLSAVEENGFRLAEIFARSSVPAVIADDYLIMQHVVNGFSSETKVRYAMLLDADGLVLVHSQANERGKRYRDASSLLAARTGAPLLQRSRAADGTLVYDFAVPVYVLQDKRASARVGLSLEQELAEIARTRNYIILIGLAVLGLGLVWAAYQAKRVVRPVQALVEGTREIARGNLGHRTAVTGGDELGQLALAFNRMTESVQALMETSREMSSVLDPGVVLRSITAYALTLVKADIAFIAPFDRDTQEASIRVVLGARTDRLQNLVVRPRQGLGGAVLATGSPFATTSYLDDARIAHDPVHDEVARAEGIVSALVVPIMLRGEIVGVLWVANRSAKAFLPEDMDSLARMANQAAIAMENARLYADTTLKTARLEALIHVSREITAHLDPSRIVHVTLEAMGALMGGIVVRLWEVRPDAEVLVHLGSHGLRTPGSGAIAPIPVGGGLAGIVAASRTPLVIEDLRGDPRAIEEDLVDREGLVSFLGLPLLQDDALAGVLCILTRAVHRFSQDEIDLFASVAQQAAIAMDNSALYAQVKRHAEELESKVQLRTRELSEANRALDAASRHKSAFLANMSHELRTPLNAIIGFTRLVMRRSKDLLPESQHENLGKILTSADHLLTLINGILDLSKIEAGRVEVQPVGFDLEGLVDLCLRTVEPMIRSDRLRLVKEIEGGLPPLSTDRDKLKQILMNLLSNSVKFTESGTVSVTARRHDGEIAIAVADTGIGIPADALELIFEEFRQLDSSTTRQYGGTGLGLSISRHLARLLGGDLTVESTVGVGSTFTVTIPLRYDAVRLAERAPGTPAREERAVPPATARIVLAIDDDPNVIYLLRETLAEAGYHVVGALGGEEGLQQARALRPFAIMLDILMPHRDGWEILHDLKIDPATRHIPVIVASIVDNKNLGFRLGASDYLLKPFDREAILTALARIAPRRGRLLVVDDDPQVVDLVRQLLEGEPYEITAATDGHEALETIAANQPDVILLDLLMPRLDGFGVIQHLQQDPQYRQIPVIVLTAKALTAVEEDLLEQSVLKVLQKMGLQRDVFIQELRGALQAYHEPNRRE
ncbi:MAG: response regulator [Candidatus Rokuibacteriota bacterium]